MRNQDVLPFSPAVFLEHLVCFVVTDDQVSFDSLAFFHAYCITYQSIHVVECLEFRHLCMILRETLIDADIPRHDKMREAVISHWRTLFEDLKLELSVSLNTSVLLN